MTAEIVTPKRHGLAVLWDLLVAPSSAFDELRAVPHWGWALVLTCVLGTLGGYLQVPAAEHISDYAFAHNPQFAAVSAEQAETAKKTAEVIQHYIWIFYSLEAALAVAGSALLLLVANAMGRGSANWARLFALAANVGFLNFGFGYLLHGVVAATRNPENFQSPVDLLNVVPNLAWLAPGTGPQVQAFLAGFSVFQIWSIVLIALGLRSIAGIKAPIAWATPILMAVIGSLVIVSTVH